jgi:hypothetical protein
MTIPEIRRLCLVLAVDACGPKTIDAILDRADDLFEWIFDGSSTSEGDSEITSKLNSLNTKIDIIMANDEQFKAALKRIDDATTASGLAATAIQGRITSLEEAIKNAGLDASTEAALLAQTEGLGSNAEALAAALTQMGKTPETPVPVEPPAPVEPVTPQ